MKDLRGSEEPIEAITGIEREVYGIQHSAFWKDLQVDCERIVVNAQKAALTKGDFTLLELAHLQGVYSIVEKYKNWPKTYLSRLQGKSEIEQRD